MSKSEKCVVPNVGIGTTTPGYLLEVKGAGSSTDGGNIAQFNGGDTPTAGNLYGISIDKGGVDSVLIGINKNTTTAGIPASSTYLSTWSSTGTLAIGRGGGNNLPSTADVFINSSGNVGIGRTNPQSSLHIGSAGYADPSLSSDTAKVYIGGGSRLGMGDANSGAKPFWLQVQQTNSDAPPYTAGELVLNPLGGNVGIGTTTPATKLDVNGTITATAISAPGVRKLLNTLTASNSATLQDTTSFTSTYKYYSLVFENVVPVSNNVTGYVQVQSGGTWKSTSYSCTNFGADPGGSGVTSSTTGLILSCTNCVTNAVADGGIDGEIFVYNPSQTTSYKKFFGQTTLQDSSGMSIQTLGGAWRGGTGAVTGIQVFFSTGNISTGTVRIYGWN